VEFKIGEHAAGANHPSQLRSRCCRIGHIAQEVGERDGVKCPISEGELFSPPLYQLDAAFVAHSQVLLCPPQHGPGQVETDHIRPSGRTNGECNTSRTGGHIEHATQRFSTNVSHHLPAPASVLAEGEQRSEAIVARRQSVK
jgi:hypothetical protein